MVNKVIDDLDMEAKSHEYAHSFQHTLEDLDSSVAKAPDQCILT